MWPARKWTGMEGKMSNKKKQPAQPGVVGRLLCLNGLYGENCD